MCSPPLSLIYLKKVSYAKNMTYSVSKSVIKLIISLHLLL